VSGEFDRIVDISDSAAGLKVEKSGGGYEGDGESGETEIQL